MRATAVPSPAKGSALQSQHGTLPARVTLRSILLVMVAVGLVYAAVVGLSVRHYGGNISALVDVGQNARDKEPGGLGPGMVVFRNSDGYDGQAYYYVADDPFLQHPTFRDAFRYQRIGYPLAVWAASLGRRAWRPAAMLAVNIAAIMAVAALSVLLIAALGGRISIWWALFCAINPSLLIAVQLDLAEPLAMALCLLGLLLYVKEKVPAAALAFAAALLTREVSVLFLLPLVVAELARRRIGRALALVASGIPYLLWQLALAATFGRGGAGVSQSNFAAPLAGIRAVLAAVRHVPIRQALVHQGSVVAVVAFVLLCLAVSAVYLWRRYDVVLGGILAHAAASLFAAPVIWIAFASAARVFGGLYPLTVLAWAERRGRPLAVLAACSIALSVITVVRTVLISPAVAYYVTR